MDFLNRRGCRILERNFRCRSGEIDIIALDKDTVCFVEVKTRRSLSHGSGAEAVSFLKQRKIVQSALFYLQRKGWEEKKSRFDVISILLDEQDKPQVEFIANAFEPDGIGH